MFVYSVSDVNRFINQMFSHEELFYGLSIEGEISNYNFHEMSGNVYFTLKDEKSSIKCIIFKEQAERLKFVLENGMQIVARGDVKVYERFGNYQLYVVFVEKKGRGVILENLNDLTKRLLSEGLFDSSKKMAIPLIPRVVGVLTAPSGAALQDIIKTLSRRFPVLIVKVFSAVVQGNFAEQSILKALKIAAKDKSLDVLIIGRGGGSEEDLSSFNSEKIVREIAKFDKPVISAVGHETNFCLVDYVADARACTPTAAAEMVCPHIEDIKKRIVDIKFLLRTYINNEISSKVFEVESFKNRCSEIFSKFDVCFLKEKIENYKQKFTFLIYRIYNCNCLIFEGLANRLKFYELSGTIKKGCFIAYDEDNKLVKKVLDRKIGDIVYLKFRDGKLKVKVLEKFENEV